MSGLLLARNEINAAKQCTTDEHLLGHLDGALAGIEEFAKELKGRLEEAYIAGAAKQYADDVIDFMRSSEA